MGNLTWLDGFYQQHKDYLTTLSREYCRDMAQTLNPAFTVSTAWEQVASDFADKWVCSSRDDITAKQTHLWTNGKASAMAEMLIDTFISAYNNLENSNV